MVVSGRLLGAADRKPLAGATVELWRAGAQDIRARVVTDGDGRFFTTLAPAPHAGRVHYRVMHSARATAATPLYFERRTDISDDLLAQAQRDGEGVWRVTFGATIA